MNFIETGVKMKLSDDIFQKKFEIEIFVIFDLFLALFEHQAYPDFRKSRKISYFVYFLALIQVAEIKIFDIFFAKHFLSSQGRKT